MLHSINTRLCHNSYFHFNIDSFLWSKEYVFNITQNSANNFMDVHNFECQMVHKMYNKNVVPKNVVWSASLWYLNNAEWLMAILQLQFWIYWELYLWMSPWNFIYCWVIFHFISTGYHFVYHLYTPSIAICVIYQNCYHTTFWYIAHIAIKIVWWLATKSVALMVTIKCKWE